MEPHLGGDSSLSMPTVGNLVQAHWALFHHYLKWLKSPVSGPPFPRQIIVNEAHIVCKRLLDVLNSSRVPSGTGENGVYCRTMYVHSCHCPVIFLLR